MKKGRIILLLIVCDVLPLLHELQVTRKPSGTRHYNFEPKGK